MMARRRPGARVVMVSVGIACCVVMMLRALTHQHCMVIMGRGRYAGNHCDCSGSLHRRAKQHRCGSEALERHRQQHEPHDQRFQQFFHDDDSSILKKPRMQMECMSTVVQPARQVQPRRVGATHDLRELLQGRVAQPVLIFITVTIIDSGNVC